jgi:hypothetical protein
MIFLVSILYSQKCLTRTSLCSWSVDHTVRVSPVLTPHLNFQWTLLFRGVPVDHTTRRGSITPNYWVISDDIILLKIMINIFVMQMT